MAESTQPSNLVSTINYLLHEVLGLNMQSDFVTVTAYRSAGKENDITIEIKYSFGETSEDIVDFFSFIVNEDKLKSTHDTTIEIGEKIRENVSKFVTKFISHRIEGMDGPEGAIARAATNALNKLLVSEILDPIARQLTASLVLLELPGGDYLRTLEDGLDKIRQDYFATFIPEIAKTFAKLGLTEILNAITSNSSPEWAAAIRGVGQGVLAPVIDNLVSNYFAEVGSVHVDIFENIKFNEVFGKVIADLLIDFEEIDKVLLDDLLGLDGDNKIEEWVHDLLSGEIKNFVEHQFIEAVEFLAGKFDADDLAKFFRDFANYDVQSILGNFLTSFAGGKLAELFVEIDSLPEALLSQLGATIASGALGEAMGALAMEALTGLFGQATASALGGAIFDGLFSILGAGVGAIAGSVIFELLDDLFDGAISDIFEGIIDWIRNDSPQAFYRTEFDSGSNEFNGYYLYSKDSDSDLRLAVEKTMEAFEEKINAVIAFVGEPASFDPYFDLITFVWGKKHFNESYASYITGNEGNKLSYNRSAEHVAKETIGAVLSHMNFHDGHPITALAYDMWKAGVAAGGGSSLSYFADANLLTLQNLVGLAHFANDYRQDPTLYDLLMASDAPIAVTILHQYLEADAKGFNAPTILEGRVLGFEIVGSASAGDTLILNGPAWQAIARGGDDTIYIGAAARQEIDGGEGTDTVILTKDRSAYLATVVNGGGYGVVLTDLASGIQITVVEVELFQFNDITLSFDAAFPQGHLIPGTDGNDVISLTLAPASQPTATVSDDTIYGAGGDDIVRAGPGKDFVLGDGGNDRLDGDAGDDRLFGWTGNDVLRGGAGHDLLSGEAGDDVLDGGAGADQLAGGLGNDIYVVDAGDTVTEAANAGIDEVRTSLAVYTLAANVEKLTGTSSTGQSLTGNGLANLISGGVGDDVIAGGSGADTLAGGLGNDVYAMDSSDTVIEAANAGIDEVRTGLASYTLGANVENLTGTSSSGQSLTGNALANRLTGGAGADQLAGGLGNDVYIVGAGDSVTELAGEGIDEVQTALAAYALAAEVENLTGLSEAGQVLTGNALANRLIGGAGADQLVGGLGNDVYIVGAGDSVTELAGEGTDEVQTALAAYALAPEVENLKGLSASGQALTGNGLGNFIAGGAGGDTLVGGGGNDRLNGGAGADIMRGGLGDDVYAVDNAGDVVEENAGEGTDTIVTTLAAYSLLGTQVENLLAASGVALDLRGSMLNNAITAGPGSDFIRLQDGGDDTANGGSGNDVFLFGGTLTAADQIDGGSGTDQIAMQGNYAGGLTFGLNVIGIENIALLPGSDTRFGDPGSNFYDYNITTRDINVAAGVQMVVDANRLRLGEDFTFNGASETDGSFFIYGGGGVDLLTGGALNDVFLFGAQGQWGATDVINGGPGGIDQLALRGNYTLTFGAGQLIGIENIGLLSAHDTRFGVLGSSYSYDLTMADANVASGVQMTVDGAKLRVAETFSFNGAAETDGSFRVFGGLVDDIIVGSRNNDFIQGNGGADRLTGGAGADIFRYLAASDSTAAAADRILDFTPGTDRIDLSRIDADIAAAGDQAFSWIGSNGFSGSAGQLRAFQKGGDWVLEGDTDGNGSADFVVLLTLQGPTPLSAVDFAL